MKYFRNSVQLKPIIKQSGWHKAEYVNYVSQNVVLQTQLKVGKRGAPLFDLDTFWDRFIMWGELFLLFRAFDMGSHVFFDNWLIIVDILHTSFKL